MANFSKPLHLGFIYTILVNSDVHIACTESKSEKNSLFRSPHLPVPLERVLKKALKITRLTLSPCTWKSDELGIEGSRRRVEDKGEDKRGSERYSIHL